MRTERDRLLVEKDRVQKLLWKRAGKDASVYVRLIHEMAKELQRTGMKIRYA
jgi:hypothetical protein